MASFQTFKDISITFGSHPNTKDLVVTKDEIAIKNALKYLILTKPGERPFNSLLGSRATALLFELLDYGTAGDLRSEILNVIQDYEPRVRVIDVIVTPNYDENGFDVYIEFEIIGRENLDAPLSTEFVLQRTR